MTKIFVAPGLIILILAPGFLTCYLSACRRRITLWLRPNIFFNALLLSLIATSYFSILLLALGRFGVTPLLVLQAGLTGGLLIALLAARFARGWRCRLDFAPFAPAQKIGLFLMGLLLLGGLALRIPPAFYVDGGQDQGVYVNLAAYYLREGKTLVADPWLARARGGTPEERRILAPFFKSLFASPQRPIPHRYEDGHLLPGFYMADPAAGKIVPQFYPLHPLWMAIFWGLFGPLGSVYSLTFFSLLALLAVYYCGRELFPNPWAALIALGILAVNVLQVWVNRYPVSETLAQFWLFSGLYLFLRGRRTGSRGALIAAAAGFGLYAFTRFPALTFFPVYVLAFWLDKGEKKNYLFYNLLFSLNLAALVYGTAFSFPYVHEQLSVNAQIDYPWQWWQALIYGGVAIGLINLIKLRGRVWWEKQGEAALRNRREILWTLLILSLVGLLARGVLYLPEGAGNWSLDQFSKLRFVQFSWYLSWPGFICALAGLVLWLRREGSQRARLLPAGVFIFSLVFVFLLEFINVYQFYYARYFVSEALPICILGLSYFLADWLGRPGPRRALGLALALFLGIGYLLPHFTNPAARVEESRGSYAALREMARPLPSNSITFVGGEEYDTPTFHFYSSQGTALRFVGNRYVLPFGSPSAMEAAAAYFFRRGRPVYVLESSWEPLAFPSGGGMQGGGIYPVLIAKGIRPLVFSEKVMQLPREVVEAEIPWRLYELRRGESGKNAAGALPELPAQRKHWVFEGESKMVHGGAVVPDAAASQGWAAKAQGKGWGRASGFMQVSGYRNFPAGNFRADYYLKIAKASGEATLELSAWVRTPQGSRRLAGKIVGGNTGGEYRRFSLDFNLGKALQGRPVNLRIALLDAKAEVIADRIEVERL